MKPLGPKLSSEYLVLLSQWEAKYPFEHTKRYISIKSLLELLAFSLTKFYLMLQRSIQFDLTPKSQVTVANEFQKMGKLPKKQLNYINIFKLFINQLSIYNKYR